MKIVRSIKHVCILSVGSDEIGPYKIVLIQLSSYFLDNYGGSYGGGGGGGGGSSNGVDWWGS